MPYLIPGEGVAASIPFSTGIALVRRVVGGLLSIS